MTLWRHHLRLNQIGGGSKSLPGGQLTELEGNNKGDGRGRGLTPRPLCLGCRRRVKFVSNVAKKLWNPPELRRFLKKKRVGDSLESEETFFYRLVNKTCRSLVVLQVLRWEANYWSRVSFSFGLCWRFFTLLSSHGLINMFGRR